MAVKLAFVAGKNYRWKDLQFYAMNGGICVHDEVTGEFYVKTRRDLLAVYAALRAEVISNKAADGLSEGERIAEIKDYLHKLAACLEEAKQQGDQTDPVVAAWFARHMPWKRSTVSMSGPATVTGAPRGLMAGSVQAAMAQMTKGAGLPRGRLNPDTVRPDRVINSRKARPKLVLPPAVY